MPPGAALQQNYVVSRYIAEPPVESPPYLVRDRVRVRDKVRI